MRTTAILSFFALLSAFASIEANALESYPYVAQVTAPQAVVRSGPEKSYYATSELRRGDEIDVYYETEDWCAVRPPEGSFSWISAVYVELDLSNHIGTVIADGLASRIGSKNTELCETVQVKLKKGEKVLVLEQLETPENAASPIWYKIAPPSGEFRWIHRSALSKISAQNEPQKLLETAQKSATSLPRQTSIQKQNSEIRQVLYQLEQEIGVTNGSVANAPVKTPPPTYPSVFDGPALGAAVTESVNENKQAIQENVATINTQTKQTANQATNQIADNLNESARQLQEGLKNSAQELSVSAQKLRDELKASAEELKNEIVNETVAATENAKNKVQTLPPLAEKLASARPDPRFDQPLYVNAAANAPAVRNETQNTVQSNNIPSNQVSVHAVDPFQESFEELKEETRIVLTRPTEDWVFETLIHRGNELYEIAPTDNDLEKVYHLVATLERTRAVRQEITYRRQFRTGGLLTPPPSAQPQPAQASTSYAANRANNQTINRGSNNISTNPADNRTNNTANNFVNNTAQIPSNIPSSRVATASTSPTDIVSAVIPPKNDSSNPNNNDVSSFDAVGMLGEFDPLPTGHPPYAVVNDKKEIICLITPATGLDLKTHIGQTVGINGILGIYRKPGKPDARHITAQGVWVVPNP